MPHEPLPVRFLPFPVRSVPFPAVLLDRAMPALTDTEWRLLCVIVRQTLGWQQPSQASGEGAGSTGTGRKERDWLTQAQLAARTGRSSKPLSRAISGLVAKGFIQVLTGQGRALDTAQERRRYPDKHWYRLHPQWIASLAGEEAEAGQSGNAASNTSGESPHASPISSADTPSVAAYGLSPHHEHNPRRELAPDEACGLNPSEACGLWPVEKVHTTKESSNKRNILSPGSSVRETLTGSLTEETDDRVLLSGETPHAETPHAHGPEMSAGLSLASESQRQPEAAPAEPGYLRQLVKDDSVDYADVCRFLLNYRDGYGTVFPQQEPPSVTWEREGRIVAGLLRRHSYAHLIRLLNRFLSHPDPRKRGYSLAAFAAAMNGLLAHEQKEHTKKENQKMHSEPPGTARRHPSADGEYPIRLWQEKDVVRIHGSSGMATRPAGDAAGNKFPEGSQVPARESIAANAADGCAGPRWAWNEAVARWQQGGGGWQRHPQLLPAGQPPFGRPDDKDKGISG